MLFSFQLSTKKSSSFPLLPHTMMSSSPASQASSCVTTPTSSTEGIREELSDQDSSGVVTAPPDHQMTGTELHHHQLKQSLTAETVETKLRETYKLQSITKHQTTTNTATTDDIQQNNNDIEIETETVVVSVQDISSSSTAQTPVTVSAETRVTEKTGSVEPQVISGSVNSSSSSPSFPNTPQNGLRPPPLAPPTTTTPPQSGTTPPSGVRSLSRGSSNESPTSPFFIPSNPFLRVAGPIPRFQWTHKHIQLLNNVLKSLVKIIEKW